MRNNRARSAFFGTLVTQLLPTGKHMLTRRFHFRDGSRVIRIPAGFITDFASVPRLPFLFAIVGDKFHGPAVVHDYLYRHPGSRSRRQCDRVFLAAMSHDYPLERLALRLLVYAGVRLFGWAAWRRWRRVFPRTSKGIL